MKRYKSKHNTEVVEKDRHLRMLKAVGAFAAAEEFIGEADIAAHAADSCLEIHHGWDFGALEMDQSNEWKKKQEDEDEGEREMTFTC